MISYGFSLSCDTRGLLFGFLSHSLEVLDERLRPVPNQGVVLNVLRPDVASDRLAWRPFKSGSIERDGVPLVGFSILIHHTLDRVQNLNRMPVFSHMSFFSTPAAGCEL